MATVEERIDESFAGLAGVEQAQMTQAREIVATLSDDVRSLWAGVEGHLQQAALQSGSAAHQLQQLRADNMSNPAGVRQRIAELEAKAPAEVKSRFDAATLALRDVLPGGAPQPCITRDARGFAGP